MCIPSWGYCDLGVFAWEGKHVLFYVGHVLDIAGEVYISMGFEMNILLLLRDGMNEKLWLTR